MIDTRAILTSGFSGGSSHRSLRLRLVQLSFSPVALGPGGTAAVRATIRFKASVLDENGEEVERESGEVSARDAATRPTPEAITANASQAVEAMYETIAAKIVEEASARQAMGASDRRLFRRAGRERQGTNAAVKCGKIEDHL